MAGTQKLAFNGTKSVHGIVWEQLLRTPSCSLLQGHGGIAQLVLHQGKLNLMNIEMLQNFENALSVLEKSNPRVFIIKSDVSNIFCAGADLKERAKLSINETKTLLNTLRGMFVRVFQMKIPTISSIAGAAIGGGLELALMTDMRFADTNSTFGLPEAKLGVIPGAGGTQMLHRTIGYSQSAELIFTGKIINAREAERIGLINKCFEQQGEAFAHSVEVAKDIMSCAPVSVAAAKEAMKTFYDNFDRGMSTELHCYEKTLHTLDRREGLHAFAERRHPSFVGK
ncbi:enoyl-CoA hydratase [Perkinsela sp. CCAP 1560/4]|nr:enoyl-CoA hydratase [Perkinsela sp. CCAP 1560/4]|eukprot:KNH01780.1 enoyl-CoA hydratase [Perkinsela sp. CCAP 1560/4]